MSNIEMEYSANTLLKKPHSVIQFDKTTGELKRPTLLLRKKNGEYICKLDYTNLKMSLVGKGLDEISFDVHKYVDGKKFPFWEQLTDLKTIEYVGYGCFETSVHINDAEETVKSCVAVSLECELGQLMLREGHYNDDEDLLHAKESSPSRTVLYNEEDPDHSLLHRVLKDKAPHWNIGFVSPRLNVDGYVYESNHFQRTYTADGVSIYDFLTGEVAAESNCIFLFDTYRRTIHCVNIESCVYDTSTMKVVEGAYKKEGQYYDKTGALLETKTLAYCEGIGQDTNILVSKQKLAQDFGVEFNKDSVKNCFYVTGGDDIINDLVAAANLSGDNYIYEFSKFQNDDMSEGLLDAFKKYKDNLKANQEKFYGPGGIYVLADSEEYEYTDGVCKDKYQNIITDFIYDDETGKLFIKNPYAYKDENGTILDENDNELPADSCCDKPPGIYTNYCNLVTRRSYLKDGKFPDTTTGETTAKDEYDKLLETFFSENIVVVVTQTISENDYAIALKNAKAYLQAVVDSRYKVILQNTTLSKEKEGNDYILNATISIVNNTNKNDFYTSVSGARIKIQKIERSVAEQNEDYVRQKLALKIAALQFSNLDYASISENDTAKLEAFFLQYNLTTLQEYVSNFKSCRDVLVDLSNGNIHAEGENANPTCDALYDKYEKYCMAAEKIQDFRESQIHMLDEKISTADEDLKDFREDVSINNYIKDTQWEEFRSFVREDEYNNGNYISDGLSDSELIEKANALLAAATKELQKACVLQRSVSVNLMNLFAIPEYRPLFHDFAIFNYIRVKVDDEIYKVRIVQLDFDENSPESIQVTFSEDVEYQDGTVSDLQDMRSQVAGIATSYNSTYRQAKQGADAQSTFQKIKEEGLLSSEFLIKNSNSEETVIDNTGILTRSMDDVDCYSDYQCKMIGKGLYLTSDNWKSVKAGIGLMQFNGKWQYGVIADTIVGNLIAAETVSIENDYIKIDKEGIRLNGGEIEWATPIDSSNILNLTDFKQTVTNQLSTLENCIPLTKIGANYVISPKIGGGYLYIASSNENDEKYYIEIDPNHESDCANKNYLFHIHKEYIDTSGETKDATIMGIDNDGMGFFAGTIKTDAISNEQFTIDTPTQTDGMILTDKALIFSTKGNLSGRSSVNGYTNDLCYIGQLRFDVEASKGRRWEGFVITPNGIGFEKTTDTNLPNSNNIESYGSTTISVDTIQTETLYSESQVNTSDKRLKTNIQPIQKPVEFIKTLQPCEFRMVSGKSGRKHFGFLAQDVEKALTSSTGDAGVLVKYSSAKILEDSNNTIDFSDNTTYTYGLRYDEFIAPIVATIQDLYKQVDALKEEIEILKEKT